MNQDPEKLLKRAKRARDECSKCINELEETLQKAKSRLSKMAKGEIEKKLQALKKVQRQVERLAPEEAKSTYLEKGIGGMCQYVQASQRGGQGAEAACQQGSQQSFYQQVILAKG